MTGRSTTARALIGATTLLLCACNKGPFATRADAPQAPIQANSASAAQIDSMDAVQLARAELAAAKRPAGPPMAQSDHSDFLQVTDNDLWHRVRDGFVLEDIDNPRIQRELAWYAKHEDYLARVSERARPFMHLIVEEFERQGLPMELALLPIVESAFKPFAYSHGRAAGIWQFIPSTGRMYGLEQNWWYDGRRDVLAATRAAASFLKRLGEEYDNNWLYALAAYNAGPGNVNKAIRRNKKRGKPVDFWNLDLPKETRQYVPRLLSLKAIVTRPGAYNITLAHIDDAPALEAVDTGGQLDLAIAAKMAEMSIEDIYRLNPGFNRWATAPKGPHRLLVPVERSDAFKTELSQLTSSKRVSWARHKIRNGETLSHIAKRYKVTVSMLRDINKLRGNNIRVGRHLLVPTANKQMAAYTLSAQNRLASKQASGGKGKRVEHTILPGDTLWDLSRSYGVGVRRIAAWNGIAPGDSLRPGNKLVLWLKKSGKSANKAVSQRSMAMQTIRYTVRKGDSLARIAQRFNIRVADLKRWNRSVSQRRYLQPGQKLKLHIDVRQQSG